MPPQVDFNARLTSFGSTRYETLREPQGLALDGYAMRSSDPDVAIELPTGYGKTLVAFLIADLALEGGKTVAYLTGNNQLTDQVILQAADLPGLDVVKFSGSNYPPAGLAAYHDARAIGVMNYWTYFNSSPRVDPADVVIFDDAHLAEQPLAGLFAIRIDRRTQGELYDRICDLVIAQTDLYPSVELMREHSAGPTTAPELLAFPHWAALADRATELLTQALPADVRRFVWPAVRPHLAACGVLVGPFAIEIRPYHPPTQTLPGYHHATQRIYRSATLGTMDDLQRRLGIQPVVNVLQDSVTPDEVGRRLLLLNPQDDEPLDDVPFGFALSQANRAGRTAWLCASHAEADEIERLLSERQLHSYRLRGGGDDGALERWSRDAAGHLVTAGRYDGLDLAGDLCRLVVLPSVPAASTEFERFAMAYLGDATFMRHRVGQRFTQALGRANRQEGDWAMYLGLAPGFGTLLAQTGVQTAIPRDVRPTVNQAFSRLTGDWSASRSAAEQFWATQGASVPEPIAPESPRLRPGRTRAAATADSAVDEVAAVTRLWQGDPQGAAEAAARAASKLHAAGEVEHAAFWRYVEAQAHFEAHSTGQAIDALRTATDGGAATGWFVRLRRVLGELRGQQAIQTAEQPWEVWDEWLRESGCEGVRRAITRCQSAIEGSHDEQAEALQILGRIAGTVSHRPRGQAVTDAIWNWPCARRIERRLWEVKTGAPDRLPRDWVNQALGQIAQEAASSRVHVVGCIVTSLVDVEEEAALAARETLCLVHVDALCALLDHLGPRLQTYADHWGSGTAAERGHAREEVESQLPVGSWLADLFGPSGGRLVRREDVMAYFAPPLSRQ